MPRRQPPRVFIVDDEPERATLRFIKGAELTVLHPEDLENQHIVEADLMLVDQHLSRWEERDRNSLACRPLDGLALSSVIRSHVRKEKRDPPAAIALLSAQLEDLTAGDEPTRHHLIARTFGLEWVFDKSDENEAQIVSLGRAVGSIQKLIEDDTDEYDHLSVGLGLEPSEWFDIAQEDIANSRPPLHSVSKWTGGMAILRWLLHQVLPYPTFLWDRHQLAIRLGVSTDWLSEELDGESSELRSVLEQFRYNGPLSDFLGDRWWGSGVNHHLWLNTIGHDSLQDPLQEWLSSMCAEVDRRLGVFVATLSDNLDQNQDLSPVDECVRIRPDGWPSFAAPAWARVDEIHDSEALRSMVDPNDKASLDDR